METIMVDTKSKEAQAFYQFSKTLPFVKVEDKKRELSDEEVEEIALELGKQVNRGITNRFLMEYLRDKHTKKNDSHNR